MDHPFLEILSGDKRKIKRIDLPRPVDTTLNYLGEMIPVKMVDFSFSGVGLYVPVEYTKNEKIILTESHLQFPQHKFEGQLVYQQRKDDGIIQVGFSLPINLKQSYLFKKNDPSWEIVDDQEVVMNLYKDLVFKSYECPLFITQNNGILTFFPEKMTDSGAIIGEIYEKKQGEIGMGPAYCCFTLFQTYHLFRTDIFKIDDTKIEIKLAPKIQRVLRRETNRVKKKERPYEVLVRLKNNYLDITFESDQVFDYSEHGISIIDIEEKFPLPKNLAFDEVTVEIKDVGEIIGKGYVKNYFWNKQEKAFVLGVQFSTNIEPHTTNWHNFILKARYPQMDFKYIENDHSRIWNLFEHSGYLHFKKEERFEKVRNDTEITWRMLEDSGSAISKRIMMRKDDEIIGHLQLDKIYPKTWCPHHLAIGSGVKSTIAQDLLSIAPPILVKSGADYMLNFTDASNQWFQKNYFSFVRSYKNPNANFLRSYVTYEVDLENDHLSLEENDKVELKYPNKYEFKAINKYLKMHYSPIEYDALGFDVDPYLKNMHDSIEKFGLDRGREYIAAYKDNNLVGISILETGSEGINIIGILDVCYIIVLENTFNIPREIIQSALISKSFAHYKNKNKRYMIFQLEEGCLDYTKYGMTFMCDTTRWVGMREVSSKFVCFTNYAYGHLFLKREMIRKKISDKKQE